MSKRIGISAPVGLKPQGALFMVGDQFLFVAERNGKVVQKYVGPGAVRQAFAAEPIDTGWIPEGVRRWGRSGKGVYMLRHHPPAIYRAWLPDRKRPVSVPMPALVFFGQGKAYYIWAMKGEKFDPKGLLYNAPCANVNGHGLICWGSNPHLDVATGFDQMWTLFWDAPFSGDHAAGANERMAQLAKSKAERFPQEELTPLSARLANPCTLEAVVERFAKRGGD
jgi:hypothetical protein